MMPYHVSRHLPEGIVLEAQQPVIQLHYAPEATTVQVVHMDQFPVTPLQDPHVLKDHPWRQMLALHVHRDFLVQVVR